MGKVKFEIIEDKFTAKINGIAVNNKNKYVILKKTIDKLEEKEIIVDNDTILFLIDYFDTEEYETLNIQQTMFIMSLALEFNYNVKETIEYWQSQSIF